MHDLVKSASRPENGNVLFLILIAVALFAALSYAVTSSTRLGENNAENEASSIDVAQVLQACTTLRQHADRFLFNGMSDTQMQLNNAGDPTDPCRTGAQCLFGPQGGGAIIPIPPVRKGAKGAMTPVQMEYEFYSRADGMYLPGYNSNKPLAMFMAQNLSADFCRKINTSLGLPENPPAENAINPSLRDECVNATSIFTFRCPLTR